MAKKKKKQFRPWCWYCDRDFEDDATLIQHQRFKHFNCSHCNRKLNSASGMSTHLAKVHKETIKKVPNALPGRDSLDLEIFGMDGVPEDDLQAYMDKFEGTSKKKQKLADSEPSSLSTVPPSTIPLPNIIFPRPPMGMPMPPMGARPPMPMGMPPMPLGICPPMPMGMPHPMHPQHPFPPRPPGFLPHFPRPPGFPPGGVQISRPPNGFPHMLPFQRPPPPGFPPFPPTMSPSTFPQQVSTPPAIPTIPPSLPPKPVLAHGISSPVKHLGSTSPIHLPPKPLTPAQMEPVAESQTPGHDVAPGPVVDIPIAAPAIKPTNVLVYSETEYTMEERRALQFFSANS